MPDAVTVADFAALTKLVTELQTTVATQVIPNVALIPQINQNLIDLTQKENAG